MREGGTQSLPRRRIGGGAKSDLVPKEGLRLGRYELLTLLGSGGMAEVWAARFSGDLGFAKLVAVKTIRPEYAADPGFRASFFEEARLAARLRHQNLVETADLGEESGILYQAMELIEGGSLADLLKKHREIRGKLRGMPASVLCKIFSDVLSGLHAAHEITDDHGLPLQLVHRDVSPQNILVGADGTAKLGDFGVAKALGRLITETEAGQLRGKPGYFSPEQLQRKPLDRRCDIYAMGIVLYEAFSGSRLFAGDKESRALAKPGDVSLPDIRIFAPGLASPIAEVVMRALAHDRERRFPTALAMREALDAAARAADAVASIKDVALLVGELCSESIEALREKVRALPAPEGEQVAAPAALAAPVALPPQLPARDDPTFKQTAVGAPVVPKPSIPPPLPQKKSAALRQTVGVGPVSYPSLPPSDQEKTPIATLGALASLASAEQEPTAKLTVPEEAQLKLGSRSEIETEEMDALERAAGAKKRPFLAVAVVLVAIGGAAAVFFSGSDAEKQAVSPAKEAPAIAAPVEPAVQPAEPEVHAPPEEPRAPAGAAPAVEAVKPAPPPEPENTVKTAPQVPIVEAERTKGEAAAKVKRPSKPEKKAPLRPKFSNPYK